VAVSAKNILPRLFVGNSLVPDLTIFTMVIMKYYYVRYARDLLGAKVDEFQNLTHITPPSRARGIVHTNIY